jgi:hypothetical protein
MAADYSSLAESFRLSVLNRQLHIINLPLTDTRIIVGMWKGGYGIYWTDYGPNEWAAWSPNLSTALCFVATIQRCNEAHWALGMNVVLGEEFDGIANRFLSEVTA